MQLVEGRTDDFLVMPSGRLVSPRKVVPLVEITPGLEEFQVVQKTRSLVTISVVKNDNYTVQGEEKMKERLKDLFREDITIEAEYTDVIPRKKGKLRIVYSMVNQ